MSRSKGEEAKQGRLGASWRVLWGESGLLDWVAKGLASLGMSMREGELGLVGMERFWPI